MSYGFFCTLLLNDVYVKIYMSMLLISCNRAKQELDGNTVICTDFGDFCNKLESNKIILAPFCGEIPCEEKIKKLSARFVLT